MRLQALGEGGSYIFIKGLNTDLLKSLDEFVEFNGSRIVQVEETEVLEEDSFLALERGRFLQNLSSDFFFETVEKLRKGFGCWEKGRKKGQYT